MKRPRARFYDLSKVIIGAAEKPSQTGRKIPQDVPVIGFDNVELSSIVHPPLTTIHQPKYEIGQAAVEVLLRLAGKEEALFKRTGQLFPCRSMPRKCMAVGSSNMGRSAPVRGDKRTEVQAHSRSE